MTESSKYRATTHQEINHCWNERFAVTITAMSEKLTVFKKLKYILYLLTIKMFSA
jgi:hypothetical protein